MNSPKSIIGFKKRGNAAESIMLTAKTGGDGCYGCLSDKPTSQVGSLPTVLTDTRVDADEWGRIQQAHAIENINSTWNLQNKSGDNFGILTLTNIEIEPSDGLCERLVSWSNPPWQCKPAFPCRYWFRMNFELLSNTGTAGNLLLRHEPRPNTQGPGTHTETRNSSRRKPTFLPDTLMWRYHYALESTYRVECDTVMEIKFDENSEFETEGLPINGSKGTKPVNIKLTCSNCFNPQN